MKKSFVMFLAWLAVPAVAVGQNPPHGGNFCAFRVEASNSNRHVFGTVETECTFGCPPWHDSHPFGNWGIDSYYGNRYDGQQFKGWATYNPYCDENMNTPEWNSCTTHLALTINRSDYWNYSNNTQQFSADEAVYGEQYLWFDTTEDEGCTRYDNAQLSFGGDQLDIYELDPILPDDYITSLAVYAWTSVLLTCPTRERCNPAETDWVPSSSNDIVSALFKYRLTTHCFYIEGKGCS